MGWQLIAFVQIGTPDRKCPPIREIMRLKDVHIRIYVQNVWLHLEAERCIMDGELEFWVPFFSMVSLISVIWVCECHFYD